MLRTKLNALLKGEMMEKEIVSVIIPCYNGDSVIDRSIKSVYDQSIDFRIELIIVDDGSTDKSKDRILEWVSLFEKKQHLLKYVYQENKGLGGAINTGLKHVTGKYLTLLDADDCFLPDSINKRVVFLEKNPDFVGVRTKGWYDKDGERRLFVENIKEKMNTNLFDGLIGGSATNWAGSYMIRTDKLFDFYPDREIYPSRFGQNMQLLLPVSYKNKFGFIDEPLMIYYLQSNSLSQAVTVEEQLKKDDRNFYGYYDIYMHMLKKILRDEEEYEFYSNIVNSWKYRHELNKSMLSGNRKEATEYFRLYENTGRITLNEKIDYYSKINPIRAIWLKVYRRMGMVLKGMK